MEKLSYKAMAKKIESIKDHLKNQIRAIFLAYPRTLYNYKQVAKALGEEGQQHKKYITGLLYALTKENILIEPFKGKFQLNPLQQEVQKSFGPFLTGTVDMKQTGKAYIISKDSMEDIRVDSNNTNNAIHGDLVKVRLFPKRKHYKTEGEIVEILERKNTKWVGLLQVSDRFAFVTPDSKSFPADIFVPLTNLNKAQNGQKVIVEIQKWEPPMKNPQGRIHEVLGWPGDNETEIHAILAQYNLPHKFDQSIQDEAAAIPDNISEEITKREDFRDIFTLTIDPADAKDLDDALSLKVLEDNTYEIGVHIADVSYYVKWNTLIDKEAQDRATSIYLVDRTIPMLPEKLSNNLCSLNPNTDKLCYSAIFTIKEPAKIVKYRIAQTVINSNVRLSYEEAQEMIIDEKGPYATELAIFNRIAQAFRTKRLKDGALAFEKKEVKFKLSDTGKPLEIYFKEQKEANHLIEEFMLLANKTVAESIGKVKPPLKPKTFVYRIHDLPNLEKLTTLANFVNKLGYRLKIDTRKNISDSFNYLLRASQGKGEENMIETLALRSMAKAEYATKNIGHYGLGFDFYTHFTSPIRRYPDLLVHRLLKMYQRDKTSENEKYYADLSKHSSEMEKRAQEAERESIKLKQVEFMMDKIGQQFEGLISGVSKWGIYVEIAENKIEGMVRISEMEDDFYFLDEENYRVIGHNKKRIYKLGDKVIIEVKSVDYLKKELTFTIPKEAKK